MDGLPSSPRSCRRSLSECSYSGYRRRTGSKGIQCSMNRPVRKALCAHIVKMIRRLEIAPGADVLAVLRRPDPVLEAVEGPGGVDLHVIPGQAEPSLSEPLRRSHRARRSALPARAATPRRKASKTASCAASAGPRGEFPGNRGVPSCFARARRRSRIHEKVDDLIPVISVGQHPGEFIGGRGLPLCLRMAQGKLVGKTIVPEKDLSLLHPAGR